MTPEDTMRRLFFTFVTAQTLVLAACSSPRTDASVGLPVDPSLRAIQRGLERRYYNRSIRVTHLAGDTLVVRFEGGMDLLSGGPGRDAEFGTVARHVAQEAAVLADGLLDSCTTVMVAAVRARRFGGFDFGSREQRTTFRAGELLGDSARKEPCQSARSTRI
jgi:hypothetical protein